MNAATNEWAGGASNTPAPNGGRFTDDSRLSHDDDSSGDSAVFAMPWIESHISMSRHPKTRRLARALDVTTPQAIGHLHALWHWTLEFYEDGRLPGDAVTRADIADGAMWDGDAGVFVDALIACGWVDVDGDTLAIHDWSDYAGRYLNMRESNAERQRRRRGNVASQDSHASVTRDSRVTTQGTHASVTCEYPPLPNLTVPNLTRPNLTGPEDEARARAHEGSAHAATSPYVGMVADILSSATFIDDAIEDVEEKVARAFTLEPRFQEAAGPREAELFVTWRGYVKKPPANWYRAWLNWLKRSCDQAEERAATNGSTVTRVGVTADERAIDKAKYSHLAAFVGDTN